MLVLKGLLGLAFLLPVVFSQGCDTNNGWEELDGYCYRVSRSVPETQFSWPEAREACMAEGGDLASITSQQEQVQIVSQAIAVGLSGQDLWMGMHQPDGSGLFEWSDGTDSAGYSFWAPDQPQTLGLTQCAYTKTEDSPGEFVRYDYSNTVMGILPYPEYADGIDTFYFGWGYSYNREWCEQQCQVNDRCAAYNWCDYHWDYSWEFTCTGRSDRYNVLEYDSYSYSGVRPMGGGSGGWWYSVNCGLRKPFACKKPVGSDTPVTVPPPVSVDSYCPEGFFSADGGLNGKGSSNKCYKMVTIEIEQTGLRWEQALAMCRSQAGVNPDLATFNTPEENAMVTAQLREQGWGYWIGLHYATREKTFVWADNSKIDWYNWGPGEPQGTDQCVELWSSPGPPGTWNNNRCDSQRGYICQTYKDAGAPIATPPPATPSTCAEGWTPYWYACYRADATVRTYTAARDNCVALGGALVSIHSEPENSAMLVGAFGMGVITGNIWLGLQRNPETGAYEWEDGWPYSYYNFAPNSNSTGDCVFMNSQGYWENSACDTPTYASICKQTSMPTPTVPVGDGYCPRGDWVKWGNRCYHFSSTTTTVTEAVTQCAILAGTDYTGSLVSIESFQENQFIASRMAASSSWIGFRRVPGTVDEFLWIDGTGFNFTYWAPGEPSDPINELCGEMFGTQWKGMWNDAVCDYDYKYFICESTLGPLPTYPAVPTSTPGECPSIEWTKDGDQCYLIRPVDYRSSSAATEICKTLTGGRGNLASLENLEKNQFVFQQAYIKIPPDQDYYSPHMWIGLSKEGYGYPYEWDDGTPSNFTNWAPGEPNDQDGSNNCVRMYVSDYVLDINFLGKWDDHKCGGSEYEYQGYVCQIGQGMYSHLDLPEAGKPSRIYESRKQHWNERKNRVAHQKLEELPPVDEITIDEVPHVYVQEEPSHNQAAVGKTNQVVGVVLGSAIGVLAITMIVATVYIKRKRRLQDPLTVDNPMAEDTKF